MADYLIKNPVLQFLADNWKICMLSNKYNISILYNLYEQYRQGVNYKYDEFACFFVPPYIANLYGVNVYDRETSVDCTINFNSVIRRGSGQRLYVFYIEDHEFAVLYLNHNEIYYIDYYVETGREDIFRIEMITVEDIIKHHQALKTGNYSKITNFNHGDETYKKSLKDTISHLVHILGRSRNLVREIFYYDLDYEPTLLDILRVTHYGLNEINNPDLDSDLTILYEKYYDGEPLDQSEIEKSKMEIGLICYRQLQENQTAIWEAIANLEKN